MQVPTRLRRDRLDDLVDIDPGPGNIVDGFGQVIASNRCGAYRNVVYTLVDQAGEPIIADLSITEALSDYQGLLSCSPGPNLPDCRPMASLGTLRPSADRHQRVRLRSASRLFNNSVCRSGKRPIA